MQSLVKNLSSIFISLALAVMVWFVAVGEENPPREGDYNQNIPIEVIPPQADLITIDPFPDTVRVRLLAPDDSWKTLTSSKFKATIDLSKLEPGFNDAPIRVEVSDPQVEIIGQTPREVSVNIEPVQTISLPLEIDVLDTPPLGYINRAPIADPENVQITGPASLISQVNKAGSEIFIRSSKETLQVSRDILIHNRDQQLIRGLQINPAKVQITLPIEQRFGYKDVSVRVRVEGQVASGYRVSNISADPPTLTLVGNPKGLGEVAGLIETTPINLDEATEDIVRIVPLSLPDGVTAVLSESGNDSPGGVQVSVEITPIEDGINLQRVIDQKGLDSNLWWRAAPNQADVFLSGPLTQLQTLRASDVEVIVDLVGLQPGVHKIEPTILRPDALRIDAILPDTVEVTIGRLVERSVSQRDLDSRYSWKSSPNQIEVRLFGPAEQLQALEPGDVKVTVDLAERGPNFYRMKPIIIVPPGLELDSTSPEIVDITIQLKSTPTITPVITNTETLSVTLTPAITITQSP